MISQEIINSLKKVDTELTKSEQRKIKSLKLTPYESAVIDAKLKIKDIFKLASELESTCNSIEGGLYSADIDMILKFSKAIEETRNNLLELAIAELRALQNFKIGYTLKNKKN